MLVKKRLEAGDNSRKVTAGTRGGMGVEDVDPPALPSFESEIWFLRFINAWGGGAATEVWRENKVSKFSKHATCCRL